MSNSIGIAVSGADTGGRRIEPGHLRAVAIALAMWTLLIHGAVRGLAQGVDPPSGSQGGRPSYEPPMQPSLQADDRSGAQRNPTDRPINAPQNKYLLLRNGNVLHGRVEQCENGCKVYVPGGEIFVPNGEIELLAGDLHECYQRKRAAVLPGDARGRLELALWCLRNDMVPAARQELAAAEAIDPRHPMIPLVARRLSLTDSYPVQSAKPSQETPPGPTLDELDQLVRDMPPGTVEKFTQVIQPILVHRCAASGCHGAPTESRFRLLRSPTTERPSRAATQRNLHAVLQHVELSQPDQSPLLAATIQPHGTCRTPPFLTMQAAQYQQLVDWVSGVSRGLSGQTPSQSPVQQGPQPDPSFSVLPLQGTDGTREGVTGGLQRPAPLAAANSGTTPTTARGSVAALQTPVFPPARADSGPGAIVPAGVYDPSFSVHEPGALSGSDSSELDSVLSASWAANAAPVGQEESERTGPVDPAGQSHNRLLQRFASQAANLVRSSAIAGRNSLVTSSHDVADASEPEQRSADDDPFDPEVFNRRYWMPNVPGRRAAAASSAPDYRQSQSGTSSGNSTSPDRTAAKN